MECIIIKFLRGCSIVVSKLKRKIKPSNSASHFRLILILKKAVSAFQCFYFLGRSLSNFLSFFTIDVSLDQFLEVIHSPIRLLSIFNCREITIKDRRTTRICSIFNHFSMRGNLVNSALI